MLIALSVLLVMQLVGEAIARGLGLTVPGPVIGLALLAAAFAVWPRMQQAVEPTATGLLRHLSLLFVPAAVGIVQHLPRLVSEGVAISVSLLVSTVATLIVTVYTFRGASRLFGTGEEER